MSLPANLHQQKNILIIGSVPDEICLMSDLLKDQFRVEVANNGDKAIKIARSSPQPDLILLDITTPEIDGSEVCRQIKSGEATQNIPIILLTDKSSSEDDDSIFEAGALDQINKPLSPPVIMAIVRSHLRFKANCDLFRNRTEFLEAEIARRIGEIAETQEVTIHVLASLAETRDVDTGSHILRTQHYVRALAKKLSTHPRFKDFLTPLTIEMLFRSAQLHDIGKVGIPDSILQKPGPLTPEEFEVIKTHTTIGRNVIEFAEERLGKHVEFLTLAKEIAYSHHEKWDGTGYPQGLSGDDIPFAARLMSVADVYDALIQRRVYMGPIPHQKAVSMIQEGRGAKFDPDMIDAFLEIQDEYAAIAARFESPS